MNKSKKKTIIYLLGAGRSGTTILATILNLHEKIVSIGEMHQFPEHIINNKNCSCGHNLQVCTFWSNINTELNKDKQFYNEMNNLFLKEESHKKIPLIILNKTVKKKYLKGNEDIFNAIYKKTNKPYLLDSSKYIARFLLLKKSGNFNIRGLYIVRDLRGVINSFNKQVQTSKKPLSTIVYYCIINFFGELVCRLNSNIIKIKYEDFIENPTNIIQDIGLFLNEDLTSVVNKLNKKTDIKIPHIIGGNRLKKNKKIKLKKDLIWKKNISRKKQIFYYLLALPLMIINKYKI